jgi:hypothetical protein
MRVGEGAAELSLRGGRDPERLNDGVRGLSLRELRSDIFSAADGDEVCADTELTQDAHGHEAVDAESAVALAVAVAVVAVVVVVAVVFAVPIEDADVERLFARISVVRGHGNQFSAKTPPDPVTSRYA